jgi:hypothetical protein
MKLKPLSWREDGNFYFAEGIVYCYGVRKDVHGPKWVTEAVLRSQHRLDDEPRFLKLSDTVEEAKADAERSHQNFFAHSVERWIDAPE